MNTKYHFSSLIYCKIIATALILIFPLRYSFSDSDNTGKEGKIVRLESLDLSQMKQEWGEPHKGKSIENKTMTIGGKKFEYGVGTHAISRFAVDLKGVAKYFKAKVGLDDEITSEPGSVVFKVYVDKKKVYESGILKGKNPPKEVQVNLKNAKRLDLIVTDAGDGIHYDHADWADAVIIIDEKSKVLPEAISRAIERKVSLTPKEKDSPKINAPDIIGAGLNNDFLYTIPVSGKRPIEYAVSGLPKGLSFDSSKGMITGKVGVKGTYNVKITAENEFGKSSKNIRISIGDGIAKTPPMGWTSWNCWGCSVDEEKVKSAADAMVESGLINYGWSYINIDDCWQGERDKITGEVTSNPKFPDMKALADYIHSKGLKFGVYTDMGTKTCAGYAGSKGFEMVDAKTYSKWGVDYVKCDWCYTEGMEPEPAYTIMGNALRECGRDIVFSICNWGGKEPWKWGEKVGGNLWRTTGDITDNWNSVYKIVLAQVPLSKYAKPGHWNDPDMLVVGKVGWGPKLRETQLTPNEQYSHISLWCLFSAPLLLGCDLNQLDDFTKNLLTNDEVLAINQDVLGKQAERFIKEEMIEVWVKELSDVSKAVGIFCTGTDELDLTDEVEYTLKWSSIQISGSQILRDLWEQKDIGEFKDSYTVKIPRHGVKLIKIKPSGK